MWKWTETNLVLSRMDRSSPPGQCLDTSVSPPPHWHTPQAGQEPNTTSADPGNTQISILLGFKMGKQQNILNKKQ